MKLLVIDYSVFVYNITDSLEKLNLVERAPFITEAFPKLKGMSLLDLAQTYVKASWIYTFYRGPEYVGLTDFIPVLVKDSKPYWRSLFYPDYKGNRKPKPDSFHSVKAVGERVAKQLNIPILEEYNYEADDIAASIVKHHNLCKASEQNGIVRDFADLQIMLWTVDSDWHQLVSESTTWFNSGPWLPLVRGPKEAREWAKKRLKVDIDHPQDIVPIKVRQGDKSDNLPPGCDPVFIDLFNTHPDYRLLDRPHYIDKLFNLLEAPTNDKAKMRGAKRVMEMFLA